MDVDKYLKQCKNRNNDNTNTEHKLFIPDNLRRARVKLLKYTLFIP